MQANNVSRHMAKFHAAELASYAQKVADKKLKNKKQQNQTTYVETNAVRSGSTSPGTGHKRRRTEMTISSSEGTTSSNITVQSPMDTPRLSLDELRATDEGSKEELTQQETEQLNAIVARWVAKHHHPFTITEDPELQELLRFAATLRKPITLPPPSSVRASVQSLSARSRMDIMRQISSEVLFYSMASEVWITAERDIFVSFSIHYLTENFERRHFTIDVREHSGHQVFSYEIKKEMLDTLIARWNLDPRYLSSMLWQSQPRIDENTNTPLQPRTQQAESAAHGFEMILAPLLHGPRELEADGMQVFFFDEMVNNAVASVPPEYQACVQFVRDQVTLFRDLAFFLTNHPRAVVRLGKLVAGSSQQRLVTDSKASWLSTLDMLKRLVKKRRVIRDFFTYADTNEGRAEFQNVTPSSSPISSEESRAHVVQRQEPTDAQWCAIECLLQLLQPFENVALAIGKEKYAGSSLTFPLLKFLKRDLEKVTNFQRVFARYLNNEDSSDASTSNQPPMNLQTQTQNIATQLEAVRNFLYTEFRSHFSRACGELMWVSQLDPRFVRMKYLSDEEREEAALRTRVVNEVKTYYDAVAAAKVTAMRDPLKWWRENTATFPLLVPLARQWLSSVGSVRPADMVHIGAGTHGDLTTSSTAQGMQVNASTGVALPYGTYAVHSEPELVRDIIFQPITSTFILVSRARLSLSNWEGGSYATQTLSRLTATMPHPRFPKIDIQELRDDFIRFELSETDASVANAIRRVMISEVPTLAIDLVSIEVNTSVMTDEFLAHRLGMIPLNFDGGLENFRQRFVYSQDCDCDENCPNCSVEFTLDVTADNGVLSVTSEALKSSDPYIRPVNFSSEEELNNTQDTGVIIAKLGPGQRLRLSAIAKLGIGKEHAKWSPVAVATYMYDPIITLNQAVLSTYTPEQKAELYKCCPTEVFETDENYEQFTVGDAMRCMYCDECVKLADSFKDNPEDDSAVSIRMREDKFIFSVEVSSSVGFFYNAVGMFFTFFVLFLLHSCSQTTGQLKPEEVVICALDLIREKLSSLKHQCLELSQDDQGSSAPITPFG
ncbi:DNA-directed RNA polymerases II [Phytophthora citrophthora]|uniref:DNA-directed RNA polymerases II n=1 Tax=Phytophthora citrophthora TaxID=4793 RepID=A0AAD9H1G5_9STRA|nr:DNA-directed RNA polymerases II [Phytophthora citrophthora]